MPRFLLVFLAPFLMTDIGGAQENTSTAPDSGRSLADTLTPPSISEFISTHDSLRAAWFLDTLFLEHVVRHDELMKYYHGDFADFLWYFTGFYVHDLGSFGKPITASFNGLPNTRWSVFLDDVPLGEPDVNWLNLNAVSLENIERIEIYRGHAAGRYGAQASAGTIHIVSRRVPQDRAITSLKFRSVFSAFEDIGVYFGRGFGDRLQMYVGGSSKKTPGEQTVQGFSGGFFSNIQQTRYAGRILMGGIRYRISEDWALMIHAQSNKDRFDAYGRNRFGDRNIFEFTTEGGLRRDLREDYHFSLSRHSSHSMLESQMFFTSIERSSRDFAQSDIPEVYRTGTVGLDLTYGFKRGSHHVQTGGAYRQFSLDDVQSPKSIFSTVGWFVSDRMDFGRLAIQPSIRLDFHSEFPVSRNLSVDAGLALGADYSVFANTGYSEAFPSLMDIFWSNLGTENRLSALTLPRGPVISTESQDRLIRESIWSFNAGLRACRFLVFDRASLEGFVHQVHDPIGYTPLNFNTDTMSIVVGNEADATISGAELQLTRKVSVFEFSVRPAFSQARRSARRAVPDFRTMFTGTTSFWTLRRNMKLTGFLAVTYYGSHSGYTFQDAPQIYYVTPRDAGGGWVFKARAMAEIGDFQLIYEAENIFRSRFTLLDGYDITRQQWRFGLIWKLYN